MLNFCFVLHANDDSEVVSNISEVYSKECTEEFIFDAPPKKDQRGKGEWVRVLKDTY